MAIPHSKHRLLGFDLAELPRDVNGFPDGHDYVTFLQFSEMKLYGSLACGLPGVWCGRNLEFPSLAERNVFVVLEGNPNLISIREGYPLASADVIEDVLSGKDVSRNRIMTIDFMVTLPPLNYGGPLRYIGLSSKPLNQSSKAAGKRRAYKEEARLAKIGFQWSYVKAPTPLEVANHLKLRSWAMGCSIDIANEQAPALAAMMNASSSTKSLARQLSMFGKRLEIPEEDHYSTLASAYYLGFLALDHKFELSGDLPPRLSTPARSFSGNRSHD